MASIYTSIRSALEYKLQSTPNLPSIAWENVDFSATDGSSFLKPSFLPTLREPAHRGINPQMRYQGIFTVDCYSPKNEGPASVDDMIDKIINAFEATTTIHYNTSSGELLTDEEYRLLVNTGGDTSNIVNVSIRYAERNGGVAEDQFFTTRAIIGWYIYA